MPDNISSEAAAALGVAVITCGQGAYNEKRSRDACSLIVEICATALYQSLGLPLPETEKYDGYLLVYGGSELSAYSAEHCLNADTQVFRYWRWNISRSIRSAVSSHTDYRNDASTSY